MSRRILLLFIGIYCNNVFSQSPQPIDTLRITTYSMLNFPDSSGLERVKDFRIVINAIQPDILVAQDVVSASGVQTLLDSIFNYETAGKYGAAPFLDGPGTDSIIFYRPDIVTLTADSLFPITIEDVFGKIYQRDFAEFVFQTSDGKELRIYSVHFLGSQGFPIERLRNREAEVLRNHLNDLPGGSHFIVLGVFNFWTVGEPGYERLIGDHADNDGRLFDPIGFLVTTPEQAPNHTYSTRGARRMTPHQGKGLDQRYDMICVSESVFQRKDQATSGIHLLLDTYTAFGNDGAHYKRAVNDGTNGVVDSVTAEALHAASDHLPVYADFVVYSGEATAVESAVEPPAGFSLHQNYPNPFNPSTQISFSLPVASQVKMTVYNLNGERIKVLLDERLPLGEHAVTFDAKGLPAGIYWYKLEADRFQAVKRFVFLK